MSTALCGTSVSFPPRHREQQRRVEERREETENRGEHYENSFVLFCFRSMDIITVNIQRLSLPVQ